MKRRDFFSALAGGVVASVVKLPEPKEPVIDMGDNEVMTLGQINPLRKIGEQMGRDIAEDLWNQLLKNKVGI